MSLILQELQDSQIELESIKQENNILKLEITEYETRINNLQQENEKLTNKNNILLQSIQLEQQNILYSRSLSDEMELINSHNADLTVQISEYQNLTKRLTSQYKTIQTENEKYKLALQQMCEQQPQKHKIHNNEILKLQNKIKTLQNECDTLRENINETNECNTLKLKPNKSFEMKLNNSFSDCIIDSQTVVSIRSDINTPKSLYFEFECCDTHKYDDIINQLYDLGFSQNEIISAINSLEITGNNIDINKVIEIIESMKYTSNDIEINKLKNINKKNVTKINKLQKRIIYLQEYVDSLKNKKQESFWDKWIPSCVSC